MFADAITFFDRSHQPYSVREASSDDAPEIVRLLTEVGQERRYIANEGEYYTVDQQRYMLKNRTPGQLILVALVDNQVMGTLEAIRGTFMKNRHVATMGMALEAGFRGSGRGSGLLEILERWAKQLGISKIAISVFESNQPAIRFYQRHGFVMEGSRPNQFYIEGRMVSEVFMGRYLS